MGKRYPKEFRDDVVRIARKGDTTFGQLAEDFGVSEASIYNWIKQADIDDGVRPGNTEQEAEELREVKRRNRVLVEVSSLEPLPIQVAPAVPLVLPES